MSDEADDMMDEARRWHDESVVCETCGTRYLPSGFGCPTCEDDCGLDGCMEDDKWNYDDGQLWEMDE